MTQTNQNPRPSSGRFLVPVLTSGFVVLVFLALGVWQLDRMEAKQRLISGVTARVNETCFEWLDAPVLRVTAADIPLPYAPALEDYVLPQTADIVRAVRRLTAY
jgi:cytochrome oxidase assembly protein ShyY1